MMSVLVEPCNKEYKITVKYNNGWIRRLFKLPIRYRFFYGDSTVWYESMPYGLTRTSSSMEFYLCNKLKTYKFNKNHNI